MSDEDEENCDCVVEGVEEVDEALVARAFPRLAGAARRARAASTGNPLAGDTRTRLSDAEHTHLGSDGDCPNATETREKVD